jgi:hypothetical protein
MNENETMQQETTGEPEHDAFLDGLMSNEEMENPQREDAESTPEEPGENQAETETVPETDETAPESTESADEEQADDEQQPAPQYVTLNFGAGAVNVPADAVNAFSQALGQDVTGVIQRGLAYDAKNAREIGILERYAKSSGLSLGEYVNLLEREAENQEVQGEVERLRARFPEGTPDEALAEIARNALAQRREAENRQQIEQQNMVQTQISRQMAQMRSQEIGQGVAAFMQQHPEIRSSADVPQEVWEIMNTPGMTLAAAWERWQAQQAQAEAEQLKQQLEIERKNQQNRQQSAGSQQGGGDSHDAFLEGLLGAD